MYVFRIIMHSALFVRFHCMLYMSKDTAKLTTLESQKEALVCTTHLWSQKKGD